MNLLSLQTNSAALFLDGNESSGVSPSWEHGQPARAKEGPMPPKKRARHRTGANPCAAVPAAVGGVSQNAQLMIGSMATLPVSIMLTRPIWMPYRLPHLLMRPSWKPRIEPA